MKNLFFFKTKEICLILLVVFLFSHPVMAKQKNEPKTKVGGLVVYLDNETDILHQKITALMTSLKTENSSAISSQVNEIQKIVSIIIKKVPVRLAGKADPKELLYPLKQIKKHLNTAEKHLKSQKKSAVPDLKKAGKWCQYFHKNPLLPLYMAQEILFEGVNLQQTKHHDKADNYYKNAFQKISKIKKGGFLNKTTIDPILSKITFLRLTNQKDQILIKTDSKKILNSFKKLFQQAHNKSRLWWQETRLDAYRYPL